MVIVQSADYQIPADMLNNTSFRMGDLPVMNIADVLRNSPKFIWTLEYHSECVQTIKRTILGGSDEALELIERLRGSDESMQKALQKKVFDEETPLNISQWDRFHGLESFLLGYVLITISTTRFINIIRLETIQISVFNSLLYVYFHFFI